jgi:hypothetical protein
LLDPTGRSGHGASSQLKETKEFLQSQGVRLADSRILDLYMTIGGIPHYLDAVEKGRSVQQNIDRLCFPRVFYKRRIALQRIS